MWTLNCGVRDCSQYSVAPMQPLPDDVDDDDDDDDDYEEGDEEDDDEDDDDDDDDDDANLQQLVGFAQFTPILLLPSLQCKV